MKPGFVALWLNTTCYTVVKCNSTKLLKQNIAKYCKNRLIACWSFSCCDIATKVLSYQGHLFHRSAQNNGNLTCHVEVDAVVAKGGAYVQAGVSKLHRLDLQLAIADTCMFSIHYSHMVFGPVDSMEVVLGRATEIETIPNGKGVQLCLRFHRYYRGMKEVLLSSYTTLWLFAFSHSIIQIHEQRGKEGKTNKTTVTWNPPKPIKNNGLFQLGRKKKGKKGPSLYCKLQKYNQLIFFHHSISATALPN